MNLQDIHLKKPYKSSVSKDQQVISRSTVPRSILEIYSKCDTPPALDKLDVFRSVTVCTVCEIGSLLPTKHPPPLVLPSVWHVAM